MSDGREILRPGDVAEKLGVTPARVYQMCAASLLPHVRYGRAVRIPRQAWDSWLEEQNKAAAASVRPSLPEDSDGVK